MANLKYELQSDLSNKLDLAWAKQLMRNDVEEP